MKSRFGLMLCKIAESLSQLITLKPKQKLYQSLYRKFLTLLFNINIHDLSNQPYLEEFFNKILLLPLPIVKEHKSQTEPNYIAGYLHQLIAFINYIEQFDNNENLTKCFKKVINNYINLAIKKDESFPKDDYKNFSIVELKGSIQIYTNVGLYGGDNPRFGVHSRNAVLSIKRDLLLKSLSVYYKDIFFVNENFQKMKKVYKREVIMTNKTFDNETKTNTVYNKENIYQLNFPSVIRNYSSAKYFTPRIFLKQDLKFFSNPYFKISHPYCKDKLNFFCQNKPIINHSMIISKKNNLLFCDSDNNLMIRTLECDLLGFKTYFGLISLCPKYLLFESANALPDNYNSEEYMFTCEQNEYELTNNKQLIIVYTEIEEIIQRRFLYMDKAIEIFLKNGKSYLVNFLTITDCQKVMTYLQELKDYNQTLNKTYKNITFNLISNYKQYFIDQNYKSKWLFNEIDTYQYLLYINKYSSRTYNDLNQYPIIPWPFILMKPKNPYNFTIEHKNQNLSIYPCIRRAEFPITLQIDKNKQTASDMYDNSLEDHKFGFHFRLHYSTLSYVILYLVRLPPFTSLQIKLQSGKFDSPNRQVNSFNELLEIIFDNFDNRELIPDMFNSFEYFYNLNCAFFGTRSYDKLLVHNIMLPSNYKSPCEFVFNLRYVLNNYLKISIHKWINMLFGEKQFTNKKTDGYYVYQKSTYAQKVNLIQKVEKYKNQLTPNELVSKISALKMNIISFGQSPIMLFDGPHSEWKKKENRQEKKEDEFSDVARLTHDSIKCKTTIEPNSIVLHFNFTSQRDKIYIVKKVFNNEDFQHSYEIIIPKTTQQKQKENIVIHIERMKYFKKENFGTSSSVSSINISKSSKDGLTSINQNVSSNSSSNFGLSSQIKTNIKNYHFILHPKYSMFDLFNGEFFVTGRNYNNKIIVYKSIITNNKVPNVKDYIYKEINTNSFVSVLYQINETIFFSGHRNGKIMEWEIQANFSKKKTDPKELNFVIKRDILSHENSMITAIHYNNKHNIILTSAEDGNIYIRKYYDFELMTIISQLKSNELYNDIFISNYDILYASFCPKKGGSGSYFECYSLNGIKVATLIDNSPVVFLNNKSSHKRRASIMDMKTPSDKTGSSSSKKLKNSEDDKAIKTRNVWVTSYGKVIVCNGNEKIYLFNGFNLCDRMRYIPEHNQDEENKKRIVNFIYSEQENLMYCLYEDNEVIRYCDDSFKNELLQKEMVDIYRGK